MKLPCLGAFLLAAACLAVALAAEETPRRHGLEIEITQPEDGSFQFGRTEIAAEVRAADPEGVERVEFFVDGVLIFIDQEAPYRCVFDFGGESRSRVVKAVAHYAGGVSVADTVITRRVVVHYEVAVDRVLLSAIVTAKEGPGAGPLPDLRREDFLLVEDGVPQEILEVSPERRPLALALLIDTSGSMVEGMKMVHEAATRCVESLRPEDRVAVIDFDTNVYLLSAFTQDREDSKASIRSTFADGGTALYDALNASFRLIAEVSGPKAIILLSDGEDTDSRLDLERVVEKARTSDTIVYSVGLGTGMLDVGLRGVLKDLSEGTGGRAFFPDNLNELDSVYRGISQELTNDRYLLSYAPTNTEWNGAWREISLNLTHKGYRVRTRKGYYAVR